MVWQWNQDKCITLMRLFKAKKLLWKPRDPNTYSKSAEDKAWEEIARLEGTSVILCRKKMSEMVRTLAREEWKIKERLLEIKAGTKKDAYVSKWYAYEHIKFILNKETEPESSQPVKEISSQKKKEKDNIEDDKASTISSVVPPKSKKDTDDKMSITSSIACSKEKESFLDDVKEMSISSAMPSSKESNPDEDVEISISSPLPSSEQREDSISPNRMSISSLLSSPKYEKDVIKDENIKMLVSSSVPSPKEEKYFIPKENVKRPKSFPVPIPQLKFKKQQGERQDEASNIMYSSVKEECLDFGDKICNRLQSLTGHERNRAQYTINNILFTSEDQLSDTPSCENSPVPSLVNQDEENIFKPTLSSVSKPSSVPKVSSVPESPVDH